MAKEEQKKDTVHLKVVKQEQIQSILFSREIGWQEIIYDLINNEQFDPWDIDITLLTERYIEKIRALEEADFFISSKVLLAASLLLRLKSEILLNRYLKNLDEILLGKKEEKKYEIERIELDEEIPELIPKSPLPRTRKVTLQELMEALNKAIKTENRRIKKEIIHKNALREAGISLPKKKINIKDQIKIVYKKIISYFKEKKDNKIPYTEILGKSKKDKIESFLPLIHLENSKKIWLDQKIPFDEIFIWHYKEYFKSNPDFFERIKQELELEHEKKRRIKNKKDQD